MRKKKAVIPRDEDEYDRIPVSSNPAFNIVLREKVELHDTKNHDYAQDGNPFSNFEFSASYAGITIDQAFDNLIGTKIARLIELKSDKKIPYNESLDQNERDLSMYLDLKRAYRYKE